MSIFSIFFLILLLHLFISFITPTMACHDYIGEASTIIRLIITPMIFIRLLFKPTKNDKIFYLTLLATNFIWVPILIHLFFIK